MTQVPQAIILDKNAPIRHYPLMRVKIKNAYTKSNGLLKILASKTSHQINKALDARPTTLEKALWVKYELEGVAGFTIDGHSDFQITLAKLRCPQWLTRRFRRIAREDLLYLSQVKSQIGNDRAYATTDIAIHCRKQQLEAHEAHLSQRAVRTGDQVRTLDEICNTSHKRVSELYVFSLGIDKLALEQGKHYMMITLTCPSHMHPRPKFKKSSGDKWDGSITSKEAYQFLNQRNEAAKRRLSNKGISFNKGDAYGITVVEPHADGCPHLHLLLYYRPEDQGRIIEEYRKEFSWSEHAIKFSIEDKDYKVGKKKAARGSTYLFKYLSESFYSIGDADLNEVTGKQGRAKRIAAWRSQINARAFRTFGLRRCATLWRQCRKLRDIKDECGPLLQSAISAACDNDFHRFHDLSRDLKLITEPHQTRYGDAYQRIVGIEDTCGNVRSAAACEVIKLSSIELDLRPNELGLGVKHSNPRGEQRSRSGSGKNGPPRLSEEALLEQIAPLQVA